MIFRQLFDRESCTYTYLVACEKTRKAALVDPVIEQKDRDLNLLKELNLELALVLETHVHADHITAAGSLREATACKTFYPEGSGAACVDAEVSDGQVVNLGSVEIQCIATPGHTDAHFAYLLPGGAILTGDALFIRGCGRTDFQSGDAGTLFDSVTKKIFSLPEDTRIFPGHDYKGQTVSTVAEELAYNPRFNGKNREEFIDLMDSLNLPDPKKIMEAVPANQNCGMKTQ